MKAKVLHIIILVLSFKPSSAELFSSTADLASLVETHGYVIERVQHYLQEQEHRLRVLRRYLNVFQREHRNMEHEESYVGNPINAYQLIHALNDELQDIDYLIELEKPERLRFPNQEDADGAATALWRLQKMYNLNVTELAAGKIRGTYSHLNEHYEEETSPMSIGALFAVGRVVYNAREYGTALQWLHEALEKYYRRDPDDSYIHGNGCIIDYIRAAYHGIHDFENAIKWTRRLMEVEPSRSEELSRSIDFYYRELENATTEPYVPVNPLRLTGLTEGQARYYPELCRGEMPVPEQKSKDLHCHYKHGPSPFLRLAPIKTELLHREPEVFVFHDTISDDEIEHLRNLSLNILERATVNRAGLSEVVSYRVSKFAWFYDRESSVVERISRRVADFTDLNLTVSEALQVNNYGIGGHYDPHYDFLMKSPFVDAYSNRIATVMFYMSDVEQGGATVFPDMQLTMFPIKNSAIYWPNLLPSGQPDFRTSHAACPVLRGSKWVSNKWIHEFGQEFSHPCGLEYQENPHIVDLPEFYIG